MNKKIDDGGPAFGKIDTDPAVARPDGQSEYQIFGRVSSVGGLTIHDWFAGMALQGLLASGIAAERNQSVFDVTEIAFAHADSMLAERKRTE